MTRPEGESCSSKSALTWPPSSRDVPTDKQDTKSRPSSPQSAHWPRPRPAAAAAAESDTRDPCVSNTAHQRRWGRQRTEKNRLSENGGGVAQSLILGSLVQRTD